MEIQPEISELLSKKIQSTKKQSSTGGASSSNTDIIQKKDDETVNLHIWDFAGHELYYTTHQVIASWCFHQHLPIKFDIWLC